MPYADKTKQAHQQALKWRVWREMKDGFAIHDLCANCGLDIYGLDPDRHTEDVDYFYHFVDPVALGARPMGKNDPVYDLIRTCRTAMKHRWVPEAFEDHDGNYQGLDPRAGAYQDMKQLLQPQLDRLERDDRATPRLT